MYTKSHQSISSRFPVKKKEYLSLETNTKCNKLYCNTSTISDSFFLFLSGEAIYATLSQTKQAATPKFTKHCFRSLAPPVPPLRLTDSQNMNKLGSITHNLTASPLYLALATQFRTSFLTTSWKKKKKQNKTRKL